MKTGVVEMFSKSWSELRSRTQWLWHDPLYLQWTIHIHWRPPWISSVLRSCISWAKEQCSLSSPMSRQESGTSSRDAISKTPANNVNVISKIPINHVPSHTPTVEYIAHPAIPTRVARTRGTMRIMWTWYFAETFSYALLMRCRHPRWWTTRLIGGFDIIWERSIKIKVCHFTLLVKPSFSVALLKHTKEHCCSENSYTTCQSSII